MKYFKLIISMIMGKLKTNKHGECPELLAQWETTEEAAEAEAEAVRMDRNQLLIEAELMARFQDEEGPTEVGTLSCGVRIRWAQAINSYDQWYVEEEADVFSMATLPSALGCSLFLGYDWPDLGYQRWELERTLEKWLAQVPAAPDESRYFTGDDELAWSQAMFDQWMQECQAEEQAVAETAYLALDTEQAWPDPPSEGLQSPCLAEPKAKS